MGTRAMIATAWACEDCLMAENGYDLPEHELDREPWSLAAPGEVYTAGLPWDGHDEDCTNRAAREYVDDCSCDQLTYSKNPCDGCGSTLYGSRHAYTVRAE